MNNPIEVVRTFIMSNFYVPDGFVFHNEASLMQTGVVDSTGVLEVTAFIESEFGIRVEDVEMVPENLDSVAAIAAFVARKRS